MTEAKSATYLGNAGLLNDEFVTDGTIKYRCKVYHIGDKPAGTNVVYIFVAREGIRPLIIYVGKAEKLSDRLDGHEKMLEAKRLGASEVWVHTPNVLDSVNFLEVERRLIQFYQPPLNAHHK